MAEVTNTETGATRTVTFSPLGWILGLIIGALAAPWIVVAYMNYVKWVMGG